MTHLLEYVRAAAKRQVEPLQPLAVGRVNRVVGLTITARGLNVSLGTRCYIDGRFQQDIEAEVVGFDRDTTHLMPLSHIDTIAPGAAVRPDPGKLKLPAGQALLGRVVDGLGRPIDAYGELNNAVLTPLHPESINPLHRAPIRRPLDVGVRSINAVLTVGRGQRLGLFAGSGVGKSVLLGMMTRFTEADVVVVALVGERGREVREFIEDTLGEQGLQKSVVVASPADEPPVMRLRAGHYATRLAEYFRDQGKNVLLLFDSLTRFAQAQREIALATGEPPATKGYPPSAFSVLPQLVERAGNGVTGGGTITAFYTVLTEGDDLNDPVADAARAILDGHIVLSRSLASEGIYPAVDLTASISRSMQGIVAPEQFGAAAKVKMWWSRYNENRDLINVGAYTPGIDEETDIAIKKNPAIRMFLTQSTDTSIDYSNSMQALAELIASGSATEPGSAQFAETENSLTDRNSAGTEPHTINPESLVAPSTQETGAVTNV